MNMNSRLLSTSRVVMLCMAAGSMVGVSQAQNLSSSQVRSLTASAKTPADHMKLSKHYEGVAAKHEAEAKQHEALAEQYTKNPTAHEQKHPMSGETAAHCKLYAEHCRKASEAAKSIAASHAAMAKQGEK